MITNNDGDVEAVPHDDGIHLKWTNLSYSIPKGHGKRKESKQILDRITGSAAPGQMVAIMGPSGSGKTTLLNLLAGRVSTKGQISGTVTANDQLRPADWRRLVGYVEQDDVLYRTLTVKETVEFAAKMRLPKRDSTEEEGDARVAKAASVMHALGLEQARDTMIGDNLHRGVSGGERKRTSIAVELVADTKLLFLDEPTSGLDAFTAFYIIEMIKERLAKEQRRTVLMTIHQPRANILSMFDKILLLSQGRTIFFGSLDDALRHFERLGHKCPELENPADFFLDRISVDGRTEESRGESEARIAMLIQEWERVDSAGASGSDGQPGTMPITNAGWPNYWATEFGYLLARAFKIQFRDYPTLIGLIAQTLIIALLLSFVFFQMADNFAGVQNRIGLLFFIPIDITFTMVMPLIAIFALDRAIIKRERYSGTYRTSAFYFAEVVSLLPVRLALSTIFSFIVYYITGLRTDSFSNFLVFLLLILMVTVTAVSLGVAIGASVPSVEIGQIIGPLLIVVFLIFGGNLANANAVTWILRWIQYTSLIFYTYQGLVQNEFSGLTLDNKPGDAFLDDYSLAQIPWYYDVVALAGLTAVFLVFGYVALRVSTKPRINLGT